MDESVSNWEQWQPDKAEHMREHRNTWKEHEIPNIHEALNIWKAPEELNIHETLNIHEAERHSVRSHPLARLLLAPCVLGPGHANHLPLLLGLIGGVQLAPPSLPQSMHATAPGTLHTSVHLKPQLWSQKAQQQRVRLMEPRESASIAPSLHPHSQDSGRWCEPSPPLCFPCALPVALPHGVL